MTCQYQHWRSDELGRSALEFVTSEALKPGEGELLVAVQAAALNFSDLLMIDDQYQVKPPRPFTPGQEVSGVVVAAGAGAHFQPGDRIASKVDWGGFSEMALVRDDMAIALPQDFDFITGAALPVSYTTAMVGLSECTKILPGEHVVIHAAAGGVGLAAVQLAKSMGAIVIGTAGSPEKRDLVKANGAEYCLDYRQANWVEQCLEITGPKRAEVVFDPVGGEITQQSLRVLGLDGRLLIVGFASGNIPQIPAHRLLLRRISAIGVYWNHDKDVAMLARVAGRLNAALAAGVVRPQIDCREGLDALPEAFDDLADRRAVGKIVLDLTGGDIH